MKLSAQALYRLGGWCLALLITALSLVPPDLRPESGTPHHFEHFAIFCATGAAFGLGYRSNRRLPLAIVLVTFCRRHRICPNLSLPDVTPVSAIF